MTSAFSFDARYCSGCKACQAACKDKNSLPTGVLWRRVVEVSGGVWQQAGDTWTNSVFSYNLSISCNHCHHPKCAGVCPTNAYTIRENGVVLLDSAKCIGCGYCAWVCPYGAPQYNAEAGHMTKCDLCFDNLEQGLPPACVAACPLRVLDYSDVQDIHKGIALWEASSDSHPYPLPQYSRTQPRLSITPHPAMSVPEQKSIANREEIKPRPASTWAELPLIIFTLSAQLAVGGFWALSLIVLWLGESVNSLVFPLLVVGASLGIGMLASFNHLGTKKNVRRVFANLRRSSLSREVLFALLFGLGWLCTMLNEMLWHQNRFEWMAATSVLGIGLIHNMAQVYRFPAGLSWNSWRTNAGFTTCAILLGTSLMVATARYTSGCKCMPLPTALWQVCGIIIFILLVVHWRLMQDISGPPAAIRIALIVLGICLSVLLIFQPLFEQVWIPTLLAAIVIVEEALGRWMFYDSRSTSRQDSLLV